MKLEQVTERIESIDIDNSRSKINHLVNARISKIIDDPKIKCKESCIEYLEKNHYLAHSFSHQDYINETGIEIPEAKLKIYGSESLRDLSCTGINREGGPVYCAQDKSIYINTAGSIDMIQESNLYGDMSLSFDIGHENGHHIDNIAICNPNNLKMYLNYIYQKTGIKYKFQIINYLRSFWNQSEDSKTSIIVNRYFEYSADYNFGRYVRYLMELGLLEKGDDVEVKKNMHAFGNKETHGTGKQRYQNYLNGYTKNTIHDSPIIDLFKSFKGTYLGQKDYIYEI